MAFAEMFFPIAPNRQILASNMSSEAGTWVRVRRWDHGDIQKSEDGDAGRRSGDMHFCPGDRCLGPIHSSAEPGTSDEQSDRATRSRDNPGGWGHPSVSERACTGD